jgi:hypothetical protein
MLVGDKLRQLGYPEETIERVLHIIVNMSFRKELESREKHPLDSMELDIVRDADSK